MEGITMVDNESVPKIETGIVGLDEILNGGIPQGRTTLINGGPGCGKSMLGMQFLYHSAQKGAAGIYITFEERADSVRKNAISLGMDIPSMETDGKLLIVDHKIDHRVMVSGEFNTDGLIAVIKGKAAEMGATRIVIDAVDVLLSLYGNTSREHQEIHIIHNRLSQQNMTTILTAKSSRDASHSSYYEFLDFLSDCVILLDNRVTNEITTRRLRILKYRGTDFGSNEYPFIISSKGIRIIPITSADLRYQALGPYISTGVERLDALMGGGVRTASCTLISGPTGTGKTTLASSFTRKACLRGERVLYINLEESPEAMLSCMLSPGIDLRTFTKDGTLKIHTALPESMGVEAHLIRTMDALEEFNPNHLVLDAVSACSRMGTRNAAFNYVMRIVHRCKERGITVILLNQSDGQTDVLRELSGLDVSSLMDTVILLNFLRAGGEVNRTLLVLKSRGSKHSNQYREFLITDNGVNIMDVFSGEGGVLTGIARKEHEARERAAFLLKKQEIERKEVEYHTLRSKMDAIIAQHRAELDAAQTELSHLKQALHVFEQDLDLRISMRTASTREEERGDKKEERGKP